MNRKRVFFGWWVLTGGTLIYSVASGTVINTLPMFYPYLMEEFGWGSEQVTRSATVFFILGAFCTPPISYLLDRYSVRRVMLLSICVFSAAFLSYRLIDSLASMTTVYIVFAVSLVGCAVVPNMVLISRWFHRHRGIAVGILLTGSSIAGAVFPLFVKGVIDNGGSWRDAVTFLAVIGTLVMLFSVVFLVRNRPQDLGLAPDGIESGITKEAEETTEPGKTFTGALKTRTFYLLAFINCSIWFCVMTVLQHQAIYLDTELGVTSKDLPLVFSLFFWCAVVGKLAFGWLSDHYNKVLIMFAAVFCLTAGLLLLRAAHADRTFLLAYAVVFGFHDGAVIDRQIRQWEILRQYSRFLHGNRDHCRCHRRPAHRQNQRQRRELPPGVRRARDTGFCRIGRDTAVICSQP